MKKSEVLEKIKQTIDGHKRKKSSILAVILLQLVENMGMLPPHTSLDKIKAKDFAWEKEDGV